MLVSPRKNGLTSLLKEVRVFKVGLQRWSARRQPVVQAPILVVQGLLCGNSSEKVRHTTGKKALAYRGKGDQKKYRYCLSCLKVRGGSLPSKNGPLPGRVKLRGSFSTYTFRSFAYSSASLLTVL